MGAIAGRRDLLRQFAPDGAVYQAGTLSANPVAMTAGLATLGALRDGAVYGRLEELGQDLDAMLADAAGIRLQRCGSMFWLIATSDDDGGPVIRTKAHIPQDAAQGYVGLFRRALEGGVYLPPSPYEVGFLSAAHSRTDIEALAANCAR